MKKILYFLLIIVAVSCSKDAEFEQPPFVVAFAEQSGKLDFETSRAVELLYSETAKTSGTVTIEISAENATYGVDFSTTPKAVNNKITLPILANETKNSFIVNKLAKSFSSAMEISFSISNISLNNANIQGYDTYVLNDGLYVGGSFTPTVGGPNEPNQVYIDLSGNIETTVNRGAWDLGFYNGDEFRVVINGSLYMAVAPLQTTNMASVTSATVASLQSEVAVGTFDPANQNYIDAPNGSITETAIAETAENNADNPVYLLNLGAEVGTATPNVGSAIVAGNPRGWKKIRILRNGEGYKLQYANLDDTTFKEVAIEKNTKYNFSFFSFNTEKEVLVEPPKASWDVCFSVFTNLISGSGSYGFSDFVFHNRKGGVQAYLIEDGTIPFKDFSRANVQENLLEENQTVIGSSWRNVFSKAVFDNKYYILKDTEKNYYKIKFLALVSKNGERGYPKFQFELLK